jgi:hypothetical protein
MGKVSDSRDKSKDMLSNIRFKFCVTNSFFKINLKYVLLLTQYWHYWQQGIIINDMSMENMDIIYNVASGYFFFLIWPSCPMVAHHCYTCPSKAGDTEI